MQALRERGLRVPEDMALVCFEMSSIFAVLSPFLTVTQGINAAYKNACRNVAGEDHGDQPGSDKLGPPGIAKMAKSLV